MENNGQVLSGNNNYFLTPKIIFGKKTIFGLTERVAHLARSSQLDSLHTGTCVGVYHPTYHTSTAYRHKAVGLLVRSGRTSLLVRIGRP